MGTESLLPRARAALESVPTQRLAHYPTPVDELARLRAALGGGPRLLIKRDDTISFAFGGNKVRKLEILAAHALAAGADTLITAGGLQSNHARVTATAAARLGMRCVLVLNGARPDRPTANTLIDLLVGAQIEYVASRELRAPAMEAIADQRRAEGGQPYVIPVGASTPLGALGLVRAVFELARQGIVPGTIVHASSSAGTQAGLTAGCALFGLPTRVVGISADASTEALRSDVARLIQGIEGLLGIGKGELMRICSIEVDDRFVGPGYGVPTPQSREAIELLARTEGIFLDPTYTAKAMAGLIELIRTRRIESQQTVLFWHTGGQVGLFA